MIPPDMRTLLLLLIMLCTGFLSVFAGTCDGLDRFDGEQLEYSMKFKGVNSAKSNFQALVDDSLFTIHWDVETRSIFNWLFHIENKYRSAFNTENCELLSNHKLINQKNIFQDYSINYDWQNKLARSNFTKAWNVPEGSVDILTMLYLIRLLEKEEIENTRFVIDVESQIWNASLKLLQQDSEGTSAIPDVDCIEVTFHPIDNVKKREWKTDLLTNRIARPGGKLTICLSPPPQRGPLSLSFGPPDSRVEMKLLKRTFKKES